MRNFKEIKSGIIIGVSFLSTILLGGIIYAAVGSVWTSPDTLEAGSGAILTSDSWNKMLANFNDLSNKVTVSIPTGIIMAYNGTACPSGWKEANGSSVPVGVGGVATLDLRGSFLRGINGDQNSRDAVRGIGDYQTDSFQGHWHETKYGFTASNTSFKDINATLAADIYFSKTTNSAGPATSTVVRASVTDGTNGAPRLSTETRPRNVAVLYCVKQ